MILLGTGTSVGVPSLGCACPVCISGDPRNHRTRCSAILGLPEGNLLLDTSPDMRQQLLREGIGLVHAVAYTHEHADHIFGMDDLRLFQFYLGHPVPIFCEPFVEQRLRKSFDYAFSDVKPTHPGAAPSLEFHPIALEPKLLRSDYTTALDLRFWGSVSVTLPTAPIATRFHRRAKASLRGSTPSSSMACDTALTSPISPWSRRLPWRKNLAQSKLI